MGEKHGSMGEAFKTFGAFACIAKQLVKNLGG